MAQFLDYHDYCAEGFDPEDIVISGIAGRFPECDNVGELKESLYSKTDLVIFRGDRYEKGQTFDQIKKFVPLFDNIIRKLQKLNGFGEEMTGLDNPKVS
ncbi:ketoacyl_synth_N domain-containing protein [Nephila pilipes]|uniref:Ketoacyl_synth_N domain-containing protein n=1 Tax=Nephila pilipes TaxID=299642 RepID=A0A8X6U0I5_NEPPI|nr:ketoacyl_synth_N domain-containing protein [Nephila pilipes]